MTGPTISSVGLDERRRRLLFRSWHRGTREMDIIMGRFADRVIADLPDFELDTYERLIEAADHDLYSWIVGGITAPDSYDTDVLRRLRAFHQKSSEAGR